MPKAKLLQQDMFLEATSESFLVTHPETFDGNFDMEAYVPFGSVVSGKEAVLRLSERAREAWGDGASIVRTGVVGAVW